MVRIKHRYLLLNILYPDAKSAEPTGASAAKRNVPYTVQFRQSSPEQLNSKIIIRMIRDGVTELFGDFGAGKVTPSLQVKYFSQATSTAIVRVTREYYRLVWASLTYITRLPSPMSRPCVIQVVRVSGTIKKSEEEAIRRARIAIRRAQRPLITASDSKHEATNPAVLLPSRSVPELTGSQGTAEETGTPSAIKDHGEG